MNYKWFLGGSKFNRDQLTGVTRCAILVEMKEVVKVFSVAVTASFVREANKRLRMDLESKMHVFDPTPPTRGSSA